MKIVTTTLFLIFIIIFSICSGSVSAAASDSSGKYETKTESPALNASNSSEDTSSPTKSSDDGKVYALAAPSTTLTVKNQIYSQLASITPSYGSENYQYISVKNNGATAATNVVVRGTTSQNTAFNIIEWWTSWDNHVTYTKNDSAFVYNPSTGAWTWTIGNLAAGKTVYLDIRMLINKTGSITSTATATAANANTVSQAFTTNVPVSSGSVDLQLTNSFSNTNPTPGSSNTLTIRATNPSILTTATGVTVNDGMPAEINITGWRVGIYRVLGGWTWVTGDTSYNPWTGVWNVDSLSGFLGWTYKQLEITFTVPTAGTTGVISTVYGDQSDSNLANNYDKASFTIAETTLSSISNSLDAQSEQLIQTSQDTTIPNMVESSSAFTSDYQPIALNRTHTGNGNSGVSTDTALQDTGINGIITSLILALLGTVTNVLAMVLGILIRI